VKSKKTTIPENDAISTKIGAVTCLLVRRLSTPKGVRVRGRDGYKLKGKTTGRAFRCRLEGCPGYRIVIKWEDGHITYPCSAGMRLTTKGWKIL
jgi:hypothetical protein